MHNRSNLCTGLDWHCLKYEISGISLCTQNAHVVGLFGINLETCPVSSVNK